MNEPSLYIQANKVQRNFAKVAIDEFGDLLRFRLDGRDSLMDVGCATGDVLMDFVVPILPKTYSKVVGTDLSPRMIQYSKKTYAEHDRVDFKVLDIGTDKMPSEFFEQFDHVTSFNCLHWVQNKRQALKNIYNMLSEDGDCLLVFASCSNWFGVLQTLAADPKWKEYTKEAHKFPTLQKLADPWLEYTKLFNEAGFSYQQIEVHNKSVVYEGYDDFRDCLTAVNPFYDQVPVDKREEFIDDMLKYYKESYSNKEVPLSDDYKYTFPHRQVVVYARK